MTNCCTGQCCDDFRFPRAPADVETVLAVLDDYDWSEMPDVPFIANMLIFIEKRDGDGNYRYTCKHYDRASKKCLEYENRPGLCKGFPYGRACTYCGYTEEKQPEEASMWPSEEAILEFKKKLEDNCETVDA